MPRCGERLHFDSVACSLVHLTVCLSLRTPQFFLDFLDGRQIAAERFGQGLDEFRLPLGDADGLGDVAQRVFGNHAVARLAEQQADGGLVVWVPKLRIS